MLEKLLWCSSMILLVALSWPHDARPLGVSAAEWRPPPPATRSCGDPVEVVGVLADPAQVADRDGETVWIRNVGPELVELRGWALKSGRATRPLDDVTLLPGERRALIGAELRPLRLANRAGEVRIRDPCGLETGLAWPTSSPGWAELDELEFPPAPWDPAMPIP